MKIVIKLETILVLCLLTILWSCKSHYVLVSSDRGKYSIDSQVPVDSSIVKTYWPYKEQMDAKMNQIIGHCAKELTKSYDLPETLLGNFFSDAVLVEGKKIDPSIDFAIPSTKGGMRNSLPKGDIHLSNVFELMPFENEMVVLKLKGSDVEELLNFIARSGGQPVAGLRMTIESQKPVNPLINGQPFDKNRTYMILTSDYVANGGDHVGGFKDPLERRSLGVKLRDALINYIKTTTDAGKDINAELDGRITKI